MTKTHSDYEFTPVTAAEALAARQLGTRVLVVDVEAFWNGTTPNWSADAIHEIMAWSDLLAYPSGWGGGIVILAPDYTQGKFRSLGYLEAWATWSKQVCNERLLNFQVDFAHQPVRATDDFGALNARWTATAMVFTNEYYSMVNESDSLAGEQIIDAFLSFGSLDTSDAYAHKHPSLLECFSEGGAGVMINNDTGIDEVVFVSKDTNGLAVRGFKVPRYWDPSGHLP